ncbi:MAG: hypothetical protein DMF46_06270 [Verrucomicrobia bacterium]|nr:MAG: hypothetical protein DMF46_06270 [Verrucomicrobiota bacterium]
MTNERINPEVLMTNYVASALRILQAGALNHSIGSRDPHRELSASSFGFVSDFVIPPAIQREQQPIKLDR